MSRSPRSRPRRVVSRRLRLRRHERSARAGVAEHGLPRVAKRRVCAPSKRWNTWTTPSPPERSSRADHLIQRRSRYDRRPLDRTTLLDGVRQRQQHLYQRNAISVKQSLGNTLLGQTCKTPHDFGGVTEELASREVL